MKELGINYGSRYFDALEERIQADTPQDTSTVTDLIRADPEPWPDPVEGDALLKDLAQTFEKYVVLPGTAYTALALFTIHTYALDGTDISPILAVL